MNNRAHRDLSHAWPVIDGPRKGERVSSKNDDFEALIGQPSTDPSQPDRVRYYLRRQAGGGYAWSCAQLACQAGDAGRS